MARISANEFSVVPIGKTKTRVHNISLARAAIPEYANIKIRSSENLRSGVELLTWLILCFITGILDDELLKK